MYVSKTFHLTAEPCYNSYDVCYVYRKYKRTFHMLYVMYIGNTHVHFISTIHMMYVMYIGSRNVHFICTIYRLPFQSVVGHMYLYLTH
jgi:hypothetical protein